MYLTLVDNKLTCTFKMPKKLTVNDVTEVTSDESDVEWFESDDDLVGSDNEGEVDSFHLWAGTDPLEPAQQGDDDVDEDVHPGESSTQTPEVDNERQQSEEDSIVSNVTSTPISPVADNERQQNEEQSHFVSLPQQNEHQYIPTPVLADNYVFRETAGPQTSLNSPYEFFELI